MGIFERGLIIFLLRYVLRWLGSNEKNHTEDEEII